MKPQFIEKNGKGTWRVDYGVIVGKRRRGFYRTQALALEAIAAHKAARKSEDPTLALEMDKLSPARRQMLAELIDMIDKPGVNLPKFYEEAKEVAQRQANGSKTVGDAIALYLADSERRGLSKKTMSARRSTVQKFGRFVGMKRPMASIKPEEALAWLKAEAPGNPQTYRTYRGAGAMLFRWAMAPINGGHAVANIFFGLEHKGPASITQDDPDAVTSPTVVMPAQVEALFRELERERPHQLAYFTLLFFAGLRPYEARDMTWEKINLNDGIVTVERITSKTRKRRPVDLNPTAVAWLAAAQSVAKRLEASRDRNKKTLPIHETTRVRWQDQARKALAKPCWIQDQSRHTCVSFSLLASLDRDATAHNHGHDVRTMMARYYNPELTREQAAQYWAILPKQ